ncbi:hypothetical protein [Mucilaginibacter sp. NFX135]|uniref:hypothetical protein n=1 Tax=Mucilaginibacter sp. NFX135 TaxID=3402687 RepID=UPI003AFA14CD
MYQTLDLNRMGLMPMTPTEARETGGGFGEEVAIGLVIAGVVFLVGAAYEAGKNARDYDKAHGQ